MRLTRLTTLTTPPWRLALLSCLLGVGITLLWHTLSTPGPVLFVKLHNQLEQIVPLVVFEHGNDFTQERITLTQLQAGETRVVALNHRPGMGYTVTIPWSATRQTSVCVGKFTDSWVNELSITADGIVSH